MPSQPLPPEESKKQMNTGLGSALWLAVQLVWDMGWIIAIPAVVLGFGGAYLDKRAHTAPLFILLGLALAISVSSFVIARQMKAIIKRRF